MTDGALQIHEAVQDRYGRLAEATSGSCCPDTACCDSTTLYAGDISWLPDSVSNLSLGCGDPLAISQLEAGQTVLDLGSGGGIDCFLAARQVGPEGRVFGVDMTPEMIARANENKQKVGLANVFFRLGQIEALPIDSDTIDVVLSNCVINLSPDKTAVFREAFRVLKPGGRLAVSDMLTLGQFSPQERADLSAWADCVTGAEDVTAYAAAMHAAGFTAVSIHDKNDPAVELAGAAENAGPPRLFSAQITALKPPAGQEV